MCMSEDNYVVACVDSGGIRFCRSNCGMGAWAILARRTPVACVACEELPALMLKQRAYVPIRRVGWLDSIADYCCCVTVYLGRCQICVYVVELLLPS